MKQMKTTARFLYSEVLFTNKVIWLLASLGWMVMIFYLSSLPDLKLSGDLAPYDFVLRKIAHMTEYGILAILWRITLSNRFFAGVIAFLYAISDEIHQEFVPTRHGALIDVLIDTVGIIGALYVFTKLREALEDQGTHDK